MASEAVIDFIRHNSRPFIFSASIPPANAAVALAALRYLRGHPEIVEVTPFQKAVETARDRAVPGDVVTLSPACAAFDQFKNFAERGKTFKTIVNGWQE